MENYSESLRSRVNSIFFILKSVESFKLIFGQINFRDEINNILKI